MAVNPFRKKFIIVGAEACGKTSLASVFSKDLFPDTYKPTILDMFNGDLEVDGTRIEFVIIDTVGQDDFKTFRNFSYLDADVALVCFSIGSQNSLQYVSGTLYEEIKTFSPNLPIVLVGNKKDLRIEQAGTSKKFHEGAGESIKSDDGRTMAAKISAFAYVECSAKNKEGIRDVFEAAVRASLIYY